MIDRDESQLVAKISALVDRVQGLTLLEHEREHVHSIVDFPSNISDTFAPQYSCDFAYWVLQIPTNDF